MLGLYAAVTRQFPDGTPPGGWFPEERITLEQAVEYYTLGSAYAEFAETRKGSPQRPASSPISSCCRSDIFDDPAARDPDDAAGHTIVGGRVVYERWHQLDQPLGTKRRLRHVA